ncbi:hypothetical protein [Streptomyces sp. B21-083]|uniref:hypothetical protein n=1 Tax=Streptomyces sp. B21-083 TaxID=3039410 RepID=UPI002FF14BB0
MASRPLSGSSPSTADVLRARYADRLPGSIEDLTGPTHGQVPLPLHIAWSGLRSYDLDRRRQCMSLYRTVLAEGQRDDLAAGHVPRTRAPKRINWGVNLSDLRRRLLADILSGTP